MAVPFRNSPWVVRITDVAREWCLELSQCQYHRSQQHYRRSYNWVHKGGYLFSNVDCQALTSDTISIGIDSFQLNELR